INLKVLRILIAMSLISQPLQTVLGDLMATGGVENTTVANLDGPGTEPSDRPAKSLLMRGITLPKSSLTMDFQEADVRDVLHLLALKSGYNIIYGADVTGPITIHLDRVPFDQAFQTVLTLKTLVALPMGPRVIRVVTSATLNSEQSQAATFTRVFRLNY